MDTHPLYTSRAGVSRYVRGLLGGLKTACPEVTVSELAWPVENFSYAQPGRAFKTAWREWVWARWQAPRELRRCGADLLHSTALPLISPGGRPQVVTLHDLALLRHPERFRAWQRTDGLRRLRKVVTADQIICVSRFTADEAMTLLQVPAGKLSVVPEGATLAEKEECPPGLPGEFFLFVGSLEPGKNLRLLADVWFTAEAAGTPLPPLVVLGGRWKGVATEGTAPRSWIFLGYQPDSVLLALYRRTRALVFPSLYEGFGLPLLEAMTAGAHVVCGRVASLPEVAGNAATYAELSVPGMWSALRRVLDDEDMVRELVRQGRQRAAMFSWERCARETAAVWSGCLR